LQPRPDAFLPKGDLRLERVVYLGKTFEAEKRRRVW
jgi:cyclic beta-1,2-glucan synthetase